MPVSVGVSVKTVDVVIDGVSEGDTETLGEREPDCVKLAVAVGEVDAAGLGVCD